MKIAVFAEAILPGRSGDLLERLLIDRDQALSGRARRDAAPRLSQMICRFRN